MKWVCSRFVTHVFSWVGHGLFRDSGCSAVPAARGALVLMLQGQQIPEARRRNRLCVHVVTEPNFLSLQEIRNSQLFFKEWLWQNVIYILSGYFSTELLPPFTVSPRFYSVPSVEEFCWRTCIKLSQWVFSMLRTFGFLPSSSLLPSLLKIQALPPRTDPLTLTFGLDHNKHKLKIISN